MTDAAGRHSQPSGTIRVTVAAPVTGPVTGERRDRSDREETGDGYFASLVKARYLLLTTFKPKGTPVSAVVQGIADGDRAYFRVRSRSGTARRLRHTDGVHVAPCRALGLWSNGPPLDAAARPLADEEASGVAGQLDRKYPVSRRSLARLLQRARHRRLAYYELLLRESIARTLTPRMSLMCNGETGCLVPRVFGSTGEGKSAPCTPAEPAALPGDVPHRTARSAACGWSSAARVSPSWSSPMPS